MANCVISTESLFDCANPPIGGVQNFVMLYNYTAWRAMVDSGTNVTRDADGTISGITNAVGVFNG